MKSHLKTLWVIPQRPFLTIGLIGLVLLGLAGLGVGYGRSGFVPRLSLRGIEMAPAAPIPASAEESAPLVSPDVAVPTSKTADEPLTTESSPLLADTTTSEGPALSRSPEWSEGRVPPGREGSAQESIVFTRVYSLAPP
jgi:hypothetical protein